MNKPKSLKVSLFVSFVVFLLALVKLSIFWISGSLVVLLSALDSVTDSIISYVNFKVVKYSRLSADSDHPYGHGKAESIAGLTQGIVLITAGFLIVYSSAEVLIRNQHSNISQEALTRWHAGFFLFTALLSMGLNSLLKRAGKKYRSPALTSDSAHYSGDFWSNLGTAFAILLYIKFGFWWTDSALAILFSIPVVLQGLKLFRENCDELMDHDVSEGLKENILKIVQSSYPDVKDIHKFRGRKSGFKYFFDFHLTLPANLTFQEVHEIVDAIEEKLLQKFDADVVIHADPDQS